ncbi:MAG: FecR family protein, partial [Pseudorhodoplanes sp.]
MSHFPRTILYALTYLSLSGVSGFTAESKIGVAAAVKNQVEGLQGGAPRTLAAGSEVFANERIRTGEASTAQLLFLDKTSLSVGPRAELSLDRFVFDPNKGTGQVVLDTVRGSFRFVTGSQNPTHYSIKTPVATLGIRGTIIDLLVQSGRTIVVLVEGAVS